MKRIKNLRRPLLQRLCTFLVIPLTVVSMWSCLYGGSSTITKIRIVHVPWSIMTTMSLEPSGALELAEQVDRSNDIVVTDSSFLEQLAAKLARKGIPLGEGHVDVRTVCLIYWANNGIDTVSFGRSMSVEYAMQYNDQYYNNDATLLKLIASKLPTAVQKELFEEFNGLIERK